MPTNRPYTTDTAAASVGVKDASVDTAQNDDRHQKSPESILKCVPALFCGCLLYVGRHDMIAAYLQHNDNYQSQTHQDTRMIPAINISPMETPVIDAYTTNAILGG